MPTIYFLRHVESKANKDNLVRGSWDWPPDQEGIQQAQERARQFAGIPLAGILSSNLSRALVLAHAISQTTGAPVLPTKLLQSWDRGVYTGKPQDKMRPYIDWFIEHPNVSVPQGESYATAQGRWVHALMSIMAAAEGGLSPLAVVTHAHVLASIPHLLSGGEIPVADHSPIDPSEVMRVSVDKAGKNWQIAYGLSNKDKKNNKYGLKKAGLATPPLNLPQRADIDVKSHMASNRVTTAAPSKPDMRGNNVVMGGPPAKPPLRKIPKLMRSGGSDAMHADHLGFSPH